MGGAVVYKYAPPTYADEIGLTSDKYLVVVDLISQIVVLAYLVDQGSSLLVSIPAAGAILIQCWKFEKATGVRPDFSRPFPWIRCERLEAVALSAKNAKADDRLAT